MALRIHENLRAIPVAESPPDAIVKFLDASWTKAASQAQLTVPANETWKILTAYAVFTTTTAVGNRVPILQLLDEGGNVLFASGCAQVHPASTSWMYSAGQSLSPIGGTGENRTVGLPNQLYLTGGQKIRWWDSRVVDAADAWTQCALVIAKS